MVALSAFLARPSSKEVLSAFKAMFPWSSVFAEANALSAAFLLAAIASVFDLIEVFIAVSATILAEVSSAILSSNSSSLEVLAEVSAVIAWFAAVILASLVFILPALVSIFVVLASILEVCATIVACAAERSSWSFLTAAAEPVAFSKLWKLALMSLSVKGFCQV